MVIIGGESCLQKTQVDVQKTHRTCKKLKIATKNSRNRWGKDTIGGWIVRRHNTWADDDKCITHGVDAGRVN